jgi:hypothetical protein
MLRKHSGVSWFDRLVPFRLIGADRFFCDGKVITRDFDRHPDCPRNLCSCMKPGDEMEMKTSQSTVPKRTLRVRTQPACRKTAPAGVLRISPDCKRVDVQRREDHARIHCVHGPDGICIHNGMAGRKHEFGKKGSVTARSVACPIACSMCTIPEIFWRTAPLGASKGTPPEN